MVSMEKKWSLSGLYSLMVCRDSYQVVGEIHLLTQVNSLSRELRLYGEVKGKEVKAWALIFRLVELKMAVISLPRSLKPFVLQT